MKLRLLLLNFIFSISTLLSSIISGTLIKTPNGYKTVENIPIGDELISSDNNHLITSTITHISKALTDTLIIIITEKGKIYAAPDQQFFDPIIQQWIKAQDLTTHNTLLDVHLNHCICKNIELVDAPDTKIYHLSTTHPHTFFATEQELLVHNVFPVFIGFAWAFGQGLQFAGITFGIAILGSYVGIQLFNRQKQKEKECNITFHIDSCGSPCPDPDDDDDNERKFNRITKTEFFQKVEKHYERWRGNIYKRKRNSKGIEDAEYLEWDYTHNDVEAYGKNRWHLGSINPQNLKIYKPAVPGRKIPK